MPECIKEVIADLRAIIISCKNGLQINDIEDDYRETFGQDIPLKDLGYKTLQEFFINYPEDFTLHGKTVRAVAKASSEHIVSLIRKQRKEKYKKSRQAS
ncbi:hypothetical protein RUM43_013987 [Polyplax serrata]|uniref:HTH OST-type domain-containing protein n=1 Tax=Polyplax serrata TaxID=468196 RepID=A0AAN8RYW1_POLSC